MVWKPQSEPEWPISTVSPGARPVPAEPLGLGPVRLGQVHGPVHLGQRPCRRAPVLRRGRGRRPTGAAGPASGRDPPPWTTARRRPGTGRSRGHGRSTACRPGAGRRSPTALRAAWSGVRAPGRVGHAERVEDGVPDVLFERPARDAFHQEPEELEGEVAVLDILLGRCAHRAQVEDAEELVGPVDPEAVEILPRHLALEAGRVHQQPPDGEVLDRPVRVREPLQLGQVAHGRIVEAEPALVAELEHRRRRDGLGDRGDAVQRPLVRSPRRSRCPRTRCRATSVRPSRVAMPATMPGSRCSRR